MKQKKVNVQMLEPQPNNGIRTIDTTSSQTIAKPLVSGCLPDLESVEFFDLMQQYRIAPMTNQQMVIDAFEAVKDWLRANSH